MFQLNGNPISIDSEQVINGVRYPHLRDPALREQLGVVEVPDPEQYDQRFYWGVGNPKQLDDVTETPEGATESITTKGLKSQWIAQVKDTAGKMLAQTDWMVVRQVERQVAVPADVATKRLAIVAECGRLETAISGCATVEELISVVSAQNWPQE
jgi:hypothetical protein